MELNINHLEQIQLTVRAKLREQVTKENTVNVYNLQFLPQEFAVQCRFGPALGEELKVEIKGFYRV